MSTVRLILVGCLILLGSQISRQQDEDIPHIEVRNWALKFGVDLWEFGKQITKMSEIQKKYRKTNPYVARKDGLMIVREMAAEVKNMLDFKMNAVMRLMESAEQAAQSPPRDTNGYLKYYASHRLNLFTDDGKVAAGAREMLLMGNRHFDHLAVNVSLSAVLLPPRIQDTDADVAAGLQWSEYLDALFVNNYESDPSLSWQYYGATSGFLRRFPGISWPPIDTSSGPNKPLDHVRDVYDFRLSDWFVGSATSPKDLAILVDAESLTSSGKIRDLTMSTTRTILDSLGPNDYVNVYHYAESAEETVSCFKDKLVPAFPQTIKELKDSLSSVEKPDTTTNLSAALHVAFEILLKYNKTGDGSQCNQAIMLITSKTEGPSIELVKKYNSPHMPVRLFVYLVGGDKSPEHNNLACTNKGFYARITNKEEIPSKVFEYIKVLARPMVLYQHDHPIHWSPVYVGGKSGRFGAEDEGQLMTSVTVPILDRQNHTVKSANLLGVVGTDVPIEEIQKLVPPYKLGVNGYSFIVDNNGRVLYHPDLRPLPGNIEYEETLKPRYISVDLSEVELAEFDGPLYPLNNSLLDLRRDMIEQKEGETDFAVKIHYDDMKRVAIRRHNYFYNPIKGTPFSLGLALPEGYGMFELRSEQEIKHSKGNVTEHFKGKNWKVHPDWTYCEYSSASDKLFETPEERILYFLTRAQMPGWKWMSLRPRSPTSHHTQASKPDKDWHYCDKPLVQSLVMDALVTEDFDKRSDSSMHNPEKQGKWRFEVKHSFIATRSGLFRWHDHQKNDDSHEEPDFADKHGRAIDSSWYKRAVDQHAIEPESFVFSVPFDAADNPKPLITATHAVFVEGTSHKAPVAVVGLQFYHSSLASHFINITSACTGGLCKKNCASDELDCYILDNNGFIIISERHEHTGKFFGEIDGTIMDSLVQDKIFRKVTVVDYQGVCSTQASHYSAATRVRESIIKAFANMGNVVWSVLLNLYLEGSWKTVQAYGNDPDGDDNIVYHDEYLPDMTDDSDVEPDRYPGVMQPPISVSPPSLQSSIPVDSSKLRSCEKKTDLYILQPERLNNNGQGNPLKGKLTNCHSSGCERPFSVQKITHTNLILLVVDTLCPCGSKKLSIRPIEALTEPGACTARRERLYRRRPSKCINYHPEELEIKYCGAAIESARATLPLTLLLLLIVLMSPVRFT